MLRPESMFFTSSGRVGIVVDAQDKDISLTLTELQRNLAAVVSGVGSASHTRHEFTICVSWSASQCWLRFRAPKTSRGSSDADPSAFGFVDGDFIEQFLTIVESPEKLRRVIEGGSAFERLKMSQPEISSILEHLQSLHWSKILTNKNTVKMSPSTVNHGCMIISVAIVSNWWIWGCRYLIGNEFGDWSCLST